MEAPQYDHGWYLNTPRGLEGPYSSAQLQEQVLAGELPLAEQVYHAESDIWVAVSELFPSFALGKPFQLPPRPVEIKTRLPGPPSAAASQDYLKLIGQKHQKGAPTPQKGKGKTPPIEIISDTPAPVKSPGLMDRTREILRSMRSNRDPMAVASSEQSFRRNLMMVASLALISLAAFGVWRYRSDAQRQPAAAEPTAVEPQTKPAAASVPKQSMDTALDQHIGSGENPVNRHLGRQMNEAPAVTPAADEPLAKAPVESPAAEHPPQDAQAEQHYDPSTFDNLNSPVAPPQFGVNPDGSPAGTPPPLDANDPSRQVATDPNAGVMPPTETLMDANGNPMMPPSPEVPPADPNQQSEPAAAF